MKPYTFIKRSFYLFLFVLAFFSFSATAQIFTSAGGDISIPDGPNAPLCTAPAAYVCKDVLVSGLPGSAILRGVSLTLIDHEFIGSLEVEVRAPGGFPTFSPLSRSGAVSPTDCGNAGYIEGVYGFQDNAPGNWWATAATMTPTDIMPEATYFPSNPGGGPAPPAGTPNNTMSQTFSGSTNGTWQVCTRDWGDNGGARLQLASLDFIIPTAAGVSVSGQVVTEGGLGIRNAIVTISGGDLPAPISIQTGTFGFYRFDDIPAGATYIVTVNAKRYFFNNPTQIINVQENIGDVLFIADGK